MNLFITGYLLTLRFPCFHAVVMETNKFFSILFIFIQFFILMYSERCDNMKDRQEYSTSPITEISFVPSDDTFPTGFLFTMICTGKKTESPWAQEKYSHPYEIRIYINGTFQGDVCPFARNDTRSVKICEFKVKRTEPNTLSAVCQVSNGYGCSYDKTTVYIKANQKPYLSQQPPRDIHATEGQDLNITCSSRVVPRPFITWYMDDVIILSHKTTWYRGTSVLMLKSIDASSQGTYVCIANNSLGQISSNGSFFTVFFLPRISLPPVNQTVVMGNRVSMECNVTGLPIPLIGWIKNGVVLGSGNGSDNETGRRMADVVNPVTSGALSTTPGFNYTGGNDMTQIGRQSTLVIESVTRDDEGKYQCYAKNAIGNTTSRHATLIVYIPEKPRFMASPRNISVLVGFNSTMTCSAAGQPRPHITWFKNMLPIIEGSRKSVIVNGNSSVLMVTYVRLVDEGEYRCKAENSAGIEYSRQAFLDVKDVYHSKAFNRSSGSSPLMLILGTLLPVLLVVMV